MERSISKSSDLSLSYLTSLGIQSFAQYAGITGGKPALVFDVSILPHLHTCLLQQGTYLYIKYVVLDLCE
jgi:hypothetical protein